MVFPRESGVLLHITSLPGPYGIGELGPEAYRLVDNLFAMGQRMWQILPTGDTGLGFSPYTTVSAFANNPLLISFDKLVDQNLLDRSVLDSFPRFPNNRVNFDQVIPARLKVLLGVCDNFEDRASKEMLKAFHEFCRKNEYWLEDYALFTALKKANNNNPWNSWAPEFKFRNPEALDRVREKFATTINHLKILQFLFDIQWHSLKNYANANGINIIGDIPIYVSLDSADVWVEPDLFQLDEEGQMVVQSGCPPDYFQKTGQLWGNPVYDWSAHEKTKFQWWINRLKKLYDIVDIVRIDHFNGLAKYWEIQGGEKTAEGGRWLEGPGEKILKAVFKALGEVPIIAEDLGEAAETGAALREKFDLPGMKILQFSFNAQGQTNGGLPENYPENCVVYTGTHDNDTTLGWFHSLAESGESQVQNTKWEERQQILNYLQSEGEEINWDLIELALKSDANTVIIPIQDILGLGSEGRMNIPGTVEGNWTWRFREEDITPQMLHRMLTLTTASNRLG